MNNGQINEHSIPQNFCALPNEYSNWKQSQVVVLPIPYDLTTSYQPGARRGPQAIIEASSQLELYDDELTTEPYRVGIHTLPPLEPLVSGPKAMAERVEHSAGQVFDAEKFPIVLGGDHSITHGIIDAISTRFSRFSVLQLDAHADLRDRYQGSPWSHATIGRRICERAQLVQLGIRSYSGEEAEFLEQEDSRITSVSAQMCHQNDEAMTHALEKLEDPVYITIDADVLDPAIMPATGTPEPGGLFWYQVLSILKRAFQQYRIIGCDVVELAPIPGMVAPDFLMAKLVYKLIGYRNMMTKSH